MENDIWSSLWESEPHEDATEIDYEIDELMGDYIKHFEDEGL